MPTVVIFMVGAPFRVKWLQTLPLWHFNAGYGWGRPSHCYQVNAQTLEAPFGEFVGDVVWLSIKRRDKAPVHDWRDLQVIKNLNVGPEHEGFEIYPAESRLVDTANQYHVFVFLDPKVRLPVGFRTREVTGAEQAAAVGARQRAFHSAV